MKTPNIAYRFVSSLFLCLLVVFSNMALATPGMTEQDYFSGELPIVLSASRLKQTAADAPVAITVIDRQMIEASGFTEIPDLLRLVPGFFVEYDSGHIQAAGYHLLYDRFVRQQQILIDGRSVYSPLLGGIPWTELPITIDDIERIEVVRGPNAATYGSNSFLGVINIITRAAVLDRGNSLKVNAGSHDLREAFLRHGNSVGNLDYRINLAYRSDDGFDDRHDSKIVHLINGRADYQANQHNAVSIQAGYSEGPRQEDNVFVPEIPPHDRHTTSQYQQVRWQHSASPTEEFHVQIYHNKLADSNYYTFVYGILPLDINESQVSERFDAELQYTASVSNIFRYAVGASYRRDQVKNELYFNTPEFLTARTRRLFGEVEYQLSDKNTINAGVMLEDNDLSNSELSPRLSLLYQPTATNTFRAGISRATRTPAIAEEHPNYRLGTPPVFDQLYFDNADVNSEQLTAYELGYLAQLPAAGLKLDLRLFYEDVSDIITTSTAFYPDFPPSQTAEYFLNRGDLLIRGMEFQFDWQASRTTRLHGGFSHIQIDTRNISDDYANAAPANSLTLLGMHNFDNNLTGSIGMYHRTAMKPLARRSNDPETMPPHTRVDIRLARSFRTDKLMHSLAIVGQNIFNSSYFSRLNNVIDQRGYVSYKIEF